jgi:hypothetical protein
MSMPMPEPELEPVATFTERLDTLRMMMEWIADRFADTPQIDTSIAWEDGEEHEEMLPPAA